MYIDDINEICLKFKYDDNIKKAISIVFPLMVFEYKDFAGVKNVFLNTRIFDVDRLDQSVCDDIKFSMLDGVNENIFIDDGKSYGENSSVGAFYSYEPVFDDNMNVVSEKTWIVVSKSDRYEGLFNTSINIPNFLHELNHAYVMQSPIYRKDGNSIYSKHGMCETVDEISLDNKVKRIDEKNIMSEEIINEFITRKMLCNYFDVSDYSSVNEKLQSINHVNSVYNNLLMDVANYLSVAVGHDNLMRYRKDNVYSIVDNFNDIASRCELANMYFVDGAFGYLNDKLFEMFILSCDRIHYLGKKDEYKREMLTLFYDVMAPVCAYNIICNNKGSVSEYLSGRACDLGEDIKVQTK